MIFYCQNSIILVENVQNPMLIIDVKFYPLILHRIPLILYIEYILIVF